MIEVFNCFVFGSGIGLYFFIFIIFPRWRLLLIEARAESLNNRELILSLCEDVKNMYKRLNAIDPVCNKDGV